MTTGWSPSCHKVYGCTKAVHGWFRVHVSGVGGGSRWGIYKSWLGLVVMMLGGWGIYKSGLPGRLEAVEH